MVLAGALLEQAEALLDKGIHPSKLFSCLIFMAVALFHWLSVWNNSLFSHSLIIVRIAAGYDIACNIAVDHMKKVADKIEFTADNIEPLILTAITSLGSKM